MLAVGVMIDAVVVQCWRVIGIRTMDMEIRRVKDAGLIYLLADMI